MENTELFGEMHEQEENGLYGRKHAELCFLQNVRLSCFQEVWQKWCESKSTQEFDEWLHAQMHEA